MRNKPGRKNLFVVSYQFKNWVKLFLQLISRTKKSSTFTTVTGKQREIGDKILEEIIFGDLTWIHKFTSKSLFNIRKL